MGSKLLAIWFFGVRRLSELEVLVAPHMMHEVRIPGLSTEERPIGACSLEEFAKNGGSVFAQKSIGTSFDVVLRLLVLAHSNSMSC